MLEFFRKYQRYFFIVITIVIIISFSFFGTYSTLSVDSQRDQTVFTSVDGSQIKRSDLEELALFISTDNEDKLVLGGIWGPNFLNNGVIRTDFLKTGLAQLLIEQYADEVSKDLDARHAKEKKFALYSHPQAKFISVENAWTYFLPNMKNNFDTLKNAQNPLEPSALDARVNLFLGEKEMPSPVLKQIFHYQEKQYGWLKPDPNLDRYDLSMFGYHTAEDWFGHRFVHLVAQFIINSAKVAELKGYKVSKEEALADLMYNASLSYQQNIQNPNLSVANVSEYFQEQLRLMRMDQGMAIKVWRQVMLFRRLFEDVGNAALVDTLAFNTFNGYANETVAGDSYHLPKELQLNDFRSLQKLELYLNAISKRKEDNLLMPPESYLSVEEVSKNTPELVQRRYLLSIARFNKDALQSKVSLKEIWNWEIEDKNWDILKKQFPEIGVKKSDSRDERFAALEALSNQAREKVDQFAIKQIIDAHPEWLQNGLQSAEAKDEEVGLTAKGGSFPLQGIKNREELLLLLDQAALEGEKPNEANQKLENYSGDGINFYRIKVKGREAGKEILTFGEANFRTILDTLLDKKLENYYETAKETNPKEYQNEDKTWKPYSSVSNQVAEQYFAKILKAVQQDYIKSIEPEKAPTAFLPDYTATLRFYAYMRSLRNKVEKAPDSINALLTSNKKESEKAMSAGSLADQWKLEQKPFHINRTHQSQFNKNEAFSLNENQWSKVNTPPNGDLSFFIVKEKGAPKQAEGEEEKLQKIDSLIGDEAQRTYAQTLLKQIKDKNGISLHYLNRGHEVEQEEP